MKACSGWRRPSATRRASAASECGRRAPGEHGQPGAVRVGFGEQDRRGAFAGGLAGEQSASVDGAGAAGEPADGDERAAEFVEREPAAAVRVASARRAERDAGG